jgi:hypothetical protein
MDKSKISNHKKLAMGKGAKVKLKAGGEVKGKEVKVKHVAMKKGGKVKSC